MPRRKQSKAAGGLVIKKVAGPLKDLFDRQALNVKQKTKAADEELLPMLDHKTKNSAQTNFKSNLAHGISDIVPRITTKHQINISEAAIDLISSSDSELSATDHEGYDHSREFTPLFPDHDSNYDTHQMNNLKSLLPNGDDALVAKELDKGKTREPVHLSPDHRTNTIASQSREASRPMSPMLLNWVPPMTKDLDQCRPFVLKTTATYTTNYRRAREVRLWTIPRYS